MAFVLDAVRLSKASLPVIAVDGLLSSRRSDKQRIATALRDVCLDRGFFYVSHHGIPAGLIGAVFEEARRFFDLSAKANAGYV